VLSFIFGWAVLTHVLTRTGASEPILLNHRWEVEPDLGAEWTYNRSAGPLTLDASRFESSRRQTRVAEAQTAILHASRVDPENRREALQAILRQLKTEEQNSQIRLVLASAAIKLSDGSDAEQLWELLGNDVATRKVIEPALIDWKSGAAIDTWRSRLGDPNATTSALLTAVEGIEVLGDRTDQAALENLLHGERGLLPLKVAAARALGAVAPTGLEPTAANVLAAEVEQRELIAAHLLAQHTSETAQGLMSQIAASRNPLAQFVAFESLTANDLTQARELAKQFVTHADSNLRRQAVAVLNRFDDEESVRDQALALQDRNLGIRSTVRENLVLKAQNPALKPAIDDILGQQLAGDRFEGIEQAILLAAALGARERCPKLVELLEHPRFEVNIRAAWALQELADSAEILDSMMPHAQRFTQRLVAEQFVDSPEVIRVSYLFEAFGRNRFEPATEMLELYIPKDLQKMRPVTRTSAIWALGKIKEGSQDARFSKLFVQRLLDNSPVEPEDNLVKFASAIAIGYIGDQSVSARVAGAFERPPSPVGLARQWALEQLSDAAENK
jgi:hypothetical protein